MIISAAGLSHRYGRTTVLDRLNLDVPEGATCALLGANGAGKTTLLRLLAGIEPVQDGRAALFGTNVEQLSLAQRQHVAYVAEGQDLPGWMTVAQLEAYCAPLYPTWDVALAARLRDRFRLAANQRVARLSRGQRMQAALLCALAARPRVLLMDEPFTGIDVAVKEELVSGLLDAASDARCTTLVATHDINEIESFVDHVAILRDARIQVSGAVDVLHARWQRIEAVLGDDTVPGAWPDGWIEIERAGRRIVAMVDAQRTGEAGRVLLARCADVRERPLSLRELYLLFGAAKREHGTAEAA